MGTLVAAADTPQWPVGNGRGNGSLTRRLGRWLWLAAALHVGMLWWLAGMPLPGPINQSGVIRVQLERQVPALETAAAPVVPESLPTPVETAPEPQPKAQPESQPEPQVEPETPAAPTRARSPTQSTTPPPALVVTEEPPLRSEDILKNLSRYRLDGRSLVPAAPAAPAAPMAMGLVNQTNMLVALDRPLPELPFEPGNMGLHFYPPGVHGSVVRAFDKITPEFGFVTSFGLEVRCVYVLVLVSCGWRER